MKITNMTAAVRGGLAAASILVALPGRAALVTLIVPVPQAAVFAPAAAIARDSVKASSCAQVDLTVRQLESSIIESEAQHWAYVMRQPGYSARGQQRKPGADITHSDLRTSFYQQLAVWYSMETVPDVSAEAVKKANDVSTRIQFELDACR